jgi:hypothetical protein
MSQADSSPTTKRVHYVSAGAVRRPDATRVAVRWPVLGEAAQLPFALPSPAGEAEQLSLAFDGEGR